MISLNNGKFPGPTHCTVGRHLSSVNLMKTFFYEKLSDDKINIIGHYGPLIKVTKENRIITEYIV